MDHSVKPITLDSNGNGSAGTFVFAASYAQQRLWFLSQLQPNDATYHIVNSFRLRGELDEAAFREAINAIVARHESLRTAFETRNDSLVQVVYPHLDVPMTLVDLTALSEETREAQAECQARAAARELFDLETPPLVRLTVYRLAAREHILVVVVHHIIADGWSMHVFYQELGELYAARIHDVPAQLPALPIQYADYTHWQNEWLDSGALAGQLAYWEQQLADAPALELPLDYTRPHQTTHEGGRVEQTLPQKLVDALAELSRRARVTPFMTLLAAFQLVLARWSGQSDILVGTPVAGRTRKEIEGLIGLFLNTLVLRTSLDGDPSLLELLGRTRQTALDAYSNQDVPFEKLLAELNPVRDLNRTPFFQVLFNMPLVEKNALVLSGIQTELWVALQTDSKFELTLYIEQLGGARHLNLVYDAALFAPERMRELLDQYVLVLAQMVANPDLPISQVSLVTGHAAQILPDPAAPLGAEWRGAIHMQLAEHAKRDPTRTAIRDAYESWTYRELDERSNQLANVLVEAGIRRGEIVAIYAHRSAALVVALLGIFKAGAATLILDPAYPAARLRSYLAAAKPRAWIQLERAGMLSADLEREIAGGSYVCRIVLPPTLRAGTSAISNAATTAPDIKVEADDIACVTFTSGTTGTPKGVLGRHGPLTHLLPWYQDNFALNASDRFSVVSGLSHDPLQRDIFTPLWLGATICMPDPNAFEEAGALAEWMREEQITFANLTPAMLQVLGVAADDAVLPALRYAFFIGETLTTHDVGRLLELAPQVTCINLYGATESQRALGYYVVPKTAQARPRKYVVPVGRGMPDTQLLVLGAGLRRAGIGEAGEIYIRSRNLARGYLDDEALTRARFLPNPWSKLADDRLYRTGDLGRYLPDGNVELTGRADRQVNVRGFRVEPSEIEAALVVCPDIQEAVVTPYASEGASASTDAGTRLVAYLVTRNGVEIDAQNVRAHLRAHLPEYMIPNEYVALRALPLTPNGKLDLNALPKPQLHDNRVRGAGSAFVTETERKMAAIWERVLGVPQVGAEDNFFELGGYSLLALKLFAQIEKELGYKLPLALLFRAPTLRELARVIDEKAPPTANAVLVPIRTEGARTPFFCVHGLGGGVIGYAALAQLLGPEQPFYGLQAHGLDGQADPDTHVEAMAARYIAAMRAVQPAGPYRIGGYCYGGIVAFEMARQLEHAGERVGLLAIFEGYAIRHAEGRRELMRPRGMARFVQNLPAWLADYGPHVYGKTVARLGRHDTARDTILEAERGARMDDLKELLTSEELSAEHRRVILAHVNALRAYQPQAYAGYVTLFRVRALSLTRSNDPAMGWGKVSEGVEIRMLPGAHYNILERPYVETLARDLGTLLEK